MLSRNKYKRLSRSKYGDIIIFLILLIFGLFMALPFIYSLLQSIKPLDELFVFPPRFFVQRPTFDNYYILTQLSSDLWVPASRYLFNSIFIAFVGTVGHVIIASMCAYPLAKYKFPGSKLIFDMIVMSLLFTYEVTFIPQYVIMSKINLLNTIWALILPALCMPLGLFLMKQFMGQIPDAIIEAAKVDGAGIFRTFYSIVMPQVKPAWLTLTIFSFQALWNREGLEFIYNESLKTFPTMLKQITSSGIMRAGPASAAAVVLIIPPIIVFLLSQSNVIETMAHSGIKG